MPKTARKRAVAHAVLLHRRQVVAAHQLAGQVLEHAGLQLRQRRPERHDRARGVRRSRRRSAPARAACRPPGRTAGSAGRSSRRRPARGRSSRATSPTYTGWNRACGARERQHGHHAQQLREQVEERIVAARRSPTAGRSSSRAPTPRPAPRLRPCCAGSGWGPRCRRCSALICSIRRTPAARHAATTLRVTSTCACANVCAAGFVDDPGQVDDRGGAAARAARAPARRRHRPRRLRPSAAGTAVARVRGGASATTAW